VKDQIYY